MLTEYQVKDIVDKIKKVSNSNFNNDISKELNILSDVLIKGINAKEIYLFGSYASGTAGIDSDIDILAIADLKGVRRTDILKKARKLLIGKITHPVDVLISDIKEFNVRKNIVTSLEFIVVNEGVKLYG